MKKLLLITLLLTSITSYAQRYSRKISRAPETNNSISILAGQAISIDGSPRYWMLVGRPNGRTIFSGINYYRNLNQWQVGLGVDIEMHRFLSTSPYNATYKTPHIVANRIFESNDFAFYAGIMMGYVLFNSTSSLTSGSSQSEFETTGSGYVGGIQGGILFKVNRLFAINIEVAGRFRETSIRSTENTIITYGPLSGQSHINVWNDKWILRFIPLRAGFRFRF